MRRILALLALGVLAACASQKKVDPVQKADLSDKLSPGCYTVDLFDPYRLEYPEPGVTAEQRKFLGVWQNGSWNDEWCHDLYVTKILADGTVEVLDAYGPYPRFKYEASVYKRIGKIEDGVLTFLSHAQAPVRYELVGDFLVGTRQDIFGKSVITMSRTDKLAEVPVPPRKPVRS